MARMALGTELIAGSWKPAGEYRLYTMCASCDWVPEASWVHDPYNTQIMLDTAWNQKIAKDYYDRKRKDAPELEVGSYVYLRRRTTGRNEYNIKTKRTSDKLDCVHLGPFRVDSKLQLPAKATQPHENTPRIPYFDAEANRRPEISGER